MNISHPAMTRTPLVNITADSETATDAGRMKSGVAAARAGARRAFTLTELVVVIAMVLLLALLVLPALKDARKRSSRIGCLNNLKQVGVAFRLWGGDNAERYPMASPVTNGGTMELIPSGSVFPHFQVMSNEVNTPKILV